MSLVTDYLDARGVPYEVIHHGPSTTSLEEARALHMDVGQILKAVVIDTRGRHAVAVIPASRRLDMYLVHGVLDDPSAHLATEAELQGDFPFIDWAALRCSGGFSTPRPSSILPCSNATGRVRCRHTDRVHPGPDARFFPRRERRLRSAGCRGGDGSGGSERWMTEDPARGRSRGSRRLGRAGEVGRRDASGKGNTMGNPVVHFEIGGKIAERTRAFYSELFGWDIGIDETGYGLVDTRSDIGIRGGMMVTPPEVPPYLTVYVAVDDLDKYLKRAEELGGSTSSDPCRSRGSEPSPCWAIRMGTSSACSERPRNRALRRAPSPTCGW